MVLQRVVASRSATKTSMIMTNYGMIRCWRFWPASLRRTGGLRALAGKSTLNRLELSRPEPTRYQR